MRWPKHMIIIGVMAITAAATKASAFEIRVGPMRFQDFRLGHFGSESFGIGHHLDQHPPDAYGGREGYGREYPYLDRYAHVPRYGSSIPGLPPQRVHPHDPDGRRYISPWYSQRPGYNDLRRTPPHGVVRPYQSGREGTTRFTPPLGRYYNGSLPYHRFRYFHR